MGTREVGFVEQAPSTNLRTMLVTLAGSDMPDSGILVPPQTTITRSAGHQNGIALQVEEVRIEADPLACSAVLAFSCHESDVAYRSPPTLIKRGMSLVCRRGQNMIPDEPIKRAQI